MKAYNQFIILTVSFFITHKTHSSETAQTKLPLSDTSQSSAVIETCNPTLHAQFKKAFNTLATKILESQNLKIDFQVSDPKAKLLNLLGVLNSANGNFNLSGDRLYIQIPELNYSILLNDNSAYESTKDFYNFYSDVSATKLSFFTLILGTLKYNDADALVKFEKFFKCEEINDLTKEQKLQARFKSNEDETLFESIQLEMNLNSAQIDKIQITYSDKTQNQIEVKNYRFNSPLPTPDYIRVPAGVTVQRWN